MGRFAALAKGDVEDANASKPVRFCACVEGEEDAPEWASCAAVAKGEGDLLLDGRGEVPPPNAEGCLPPKSFGPDTLANGELVDA